MTVRFWCPWCGETARADSVDRAVACVRCEVEFRALFGFIPRTDMVPLAQGEDPGEPASARKRFTFYDPETGEEVGRTAQAGRRVIAS